MADIRQQPTYDNLGLTRDPGVQPVPLSRSTRPALIQLVQLALSIATSSVFIVTVDFIVTAVNNSLTAARLLLAGARERYTATCALSVACVARAKTCVAFGSGVFWFSTVLLVSTSAFTTLAAGAGVAVRTTRSLGARCTRQHAARSIQCCVRLCVRAHTCPSPPTTCLSHCHAQKFLNGERCA